MEISIPTWNGTTKCYTFTFLQSNIVYDYLTYYDNTTKETDLPAFTEKEAEPVLREFIEKTKKYFTNPLTLEKVLRHLRQTKQIGEHPQKAGWFNFQWKPRLFYVKPGEFELVWMSDSFEEGNPLIPAEFTASTTPRAQSPEVPEQTRNIQIHDSLIPVGDLPLSDLPPLAFTSEELDPTREEITRRIREARLKVTLAKLKAQRMEHKYFEKYGQTLEDSDDSSDFSTDSEEELSFEAGAKR